MNKKNYLQVMIFNVSSTDMADWPWNRMNYTASLTSYDDNLKLKRNKKYKQLHSRMECKNLQNMIHL